MAKHRSDDEYLGFAKKSTGKDDAAPASSDAVVDDGAYLDSWYQVLKAKADDTDDTDEA